MQSSKGQPHPRHAFFGQYKQASIPRLFARNERLVMSLASEQGRIAMVLVGAAIVAAINP